jgi:tRNA G18 (ribose-2'-O)-methylase SpoU
MKCTPSGRAPHAHDGVRRGRQQQLGFCQNHQTIGEAVSHLKGRGMQVLATNLSAKAVDFREIDYTRPTCILMGQEKTGITRKRWIWRIRTSSSR